MLVHDLLIPGIALVTPALLERDVGFVERFLRAAVCKRIPENRAECVAT